MWWETGVAKKIQRKRLYILVLEAPCEGKGMYKKQKTERQENGKVWENEDEQSLWVLLYCIKTSFLQILIPSNIFSQNMIDVLVFLLVFSSASFLVCQFSRLSIFLMWARTVEKIFPHLPPKIRLQKHVHTSGTRYRKKKKKKKKEGNWQIFINGFRNHKHCSSGTTSA